MNKKTHLIEIETSISSNELIFELATNLHHLEGANISIITNNKDIMIKELIKRLEQDQSSAKQRMLAFDLDSSMHSYNKAIMIQAASTLYDIKELEL